MYYTSIEAAKILKVNVNTIYKWIKENKLKAIRIGGLIRIPSEEIDNMVSNTSGKRD